MTAATLTIEASAVTPSELDKLEEAATRLGSDSQLSAYMLNVVAELRSGMDLTTLESEAELSPAAAAELLKMSRTFLMRYIEDGEVESRKVGAHHRIPVKSLLEFRERVLAGREVTAHALGNAAAASDRARQDARARARAARLKAASES